MNFEEIKLEMKKNLELIGFCEDDKKIQSFFEYMQLLLEWNEKINLTAITDEKEIILKHFIDSLTISKYCDGGKLIDVGTGAGFPGIPLKIWNDNLDVTLLDSLNKRITFLEKIIKELKLNNTYAIHGRAENVALQDEYREQYDYAVSRAVAPMNVLLEYMLPFVKVGGKCICMKGSNIKELDEAKKALEILGGKVVEIEEFCLPNTEIKRNNIIIEKIRKTPQKYPRKAGKPGKEPIF